MLPLLLLACSRPVSISQAPSPATPAGRVRFVAVGDTGKGDAGQRAVAQAIHQTCAERGCDFILLLGDNLYPRGMSSPTDPAAEARIRDMYSASDVPIYLALGNHDYAHGRDQRRAQWQIDWAQRTPGVTLPAHAYDFSAGPARLFVLDTNALFQFGDQGQGAWLAHGLEQAQGWRVVVVHHPYRSNGRHGNAGQYEGWSNIPWLSGRSLERLFRDTLCGEADLYLSGHEHTLQHLERCGVQLVVSGAGATTTALVDRGNTPYFSSDNVGFAWLELRGARGHLMFIDAAGRPMYDTQWTR